MGLYIPFDIKSAAVDGDNKFIGLIVRICFSAIGDIHYTLNCK